MTILGIDGGGTKTQAVLAMADGSVITELTGGPTNPASNGLEAAVIEFQAILEKILQGQPTPESVVLGLAGIDTALDAETFLAAIEPFTVAMGLPRCVVVNDAEIALENGSQADNALILISGTGSICYGRTPRMSWRAGGMDYLLSDEGSGYWMGRSILRSVVRAADGRRPPTQFTNLVFDHFGISSIDELKQRVYNPPLTKTQVAAVAQLWEAALAMGDDVATSLQDRAVRQLNGLVNAVVKALSLETDPFDLVLAGSIATHQAIITFLRARLREEYPQVNIVIPTGPPVFGAVKMAKKLISQV